MDLNDKILKLNPQSFGVSAHCLQQIQNFLQENGYEVERLIGWGSQGPVILAKNLQTNNQVAIKRFYIENEEHLEIYLRQFSQLSQLKSPYTVNKKGVLIDINDSNNQCLYLVMEYLPNGNLEEFIKMSNLLSSQQIVEIFITIIKGLLFLKENNINHGDLKLSNVLLASDNSPVLTDFGLSQFTDKENKNKGSQSSTGWNSGDQFFSFEQDFEAAGKILLDLCVKSDIQEINPFQMNKFADISSGSNHNILKLGFELMVQNSINHTLAKMILNELQKLQEHPQTIIIKKDQEKPQLFEMYLKMNKIHSLLFLSEPNFFLHQNDLQLSSLFLNLQSMSIVDASAQSLLSPIKYLLNLSILSVNLNYNNITDAGAKNLLLPLSNLLNLSSLTILLEYNPIGDDGAKSLLSPLANLSKLSNLSLQLNWNSIKEVGAQYLLEPLSKLNNLSTFQLDLFSNSIGDIGAKSILLPLKNLSNLSSLSLNLQWNEIGVIGAYFLLLPIVNSLNLDMISLNLQGNIIRNIGAQNLLLPLKNLINISSLFLDLVGNSIGEIGAQSLLVPLSNLENLKSITLNLERNSIGVTGAHSLLLPLSNLNHISEISIDLNTNLFGHIGAKSLLLPLGNLINLQILSLNVSTNQLGDIGLLSLLHTLTGLLNLQEIKIKAFHNLIHKKIFHLCKVLFKKVIFSLDVEEPEN